MAKVILAIIEKYFNTTRAILVVHRCNCYICVAMAGRYMPHYED